MGTSSMQGPLSVEGAKPIITGPTNPTGGSAAMLHYNTDAAPSLFWMGVAMRDPEYLSKPGGAAMVSGAYPNQDCGWYMGTDGLVLVDQVPSLLSSTAIAGAQAAASGTALTLAGAAGGITLVATGGYQILPTGLTVPASALVIDGLPQWLGAGQSGAFAFFDPTRGVSRAVSVTANAGATGGVIQVKGYDVYGKPMTENITAVAASTVNGKKAFKFVASATPQFTDAGHTYAVGTTDIYGFPIRVDRFTYVAMAWDTAWVTNNTGFVAAVTTNPATATTGDVRGSYTPLSASDNARRLYISAMPTLANALATTGWASAVSGLKGVTQF